MRSARFSSAIIVTYHTFRRSRQRFVNFLHVGIKPDQNPHIFRQFVTHKLHISRSVMPESTFLMPKIHDFLRITRLCVITAITSSFAILFGAWVVVWLALDMLRAIVRSNRGRVTPYVTILVSPVAERAIRQSSSGDKESSCNDQST